MADALDFAVVTAMVLAGVQLSAPRIRRALVRVTPQARSFGGGIGLAYVFLHLFPEIDNVHRWLGSHVYIVTLASFLLFFTVESILFGRARRLKARGDAEGEVASVFWLHIGIMVVYTSMVMFTLPDRIGGSLLFAGATGLAIGLHLIYKDYLLRHHLDSRFQVAGRTVLALAPLIGWAAHLAIRPPEVVLDLCIAALAGVLIQGVFRDELPRPDQALMRWLVAGVVTFWALSALS